MLALLMTTTRAPRSSWQGSRPGQSSYITRGWPKDARETLREAGLLRTTWGGVIVKAEARGWFTKHQQSLAGNWTTCACGELSVLIPTDDQGTPVDLDLRRAGQAFASMVVRHKAKAAARLLVEIEARARIVANQIITQGLPKLYQGENQRQQ